MTPLGVYVNQKSLVFPGLNNTTLHQKQWHCCWRDCWVQFIDVKVRHNRGHGVYSVSLHGIWYSFPMPLALLAKLALRLWLTDIEELSIGNWTVTIKKFTFRLRFQSIILNFEQPNGYFLISFMTLTCCEKKLNRLEKCLGLGLSESRSRSRLGLKFKRLGLVSVLEKCGKVLISVSSRTKKQVSRSRLGLGPEGLVYNPGITPWAVPDDNSIK